MRRQKAHDAVEHKGCLSDWLQFIEVGRMMGPYLTYDF